MPLIKNRKIGVVGAGIYGVTIASELAKNYSVDLFEMRDDILKAASGINQYRLHKGYHYPRSSATALSSIDSESSFRKEYQDSLVDDIDVFYCIAKENSRTSKSEYLRFLKKHRLEYQIFQTSLINQNKVALTIKAIESLIDPYKLKSVAWKKLKQSKVNVLLNTYADHNIFRNYDYVIVCTYAHINKTIKKYDNKHRDYQYELCEKIVVKLPEDFKKKSIIVLDGPFMCIDPFGKTGMYVMGNVVHAIHQANVGKYPKISKKFLSLLNNGIIKNPPFSNFKSFIESTEQFIPKIKYAKYFGSMFTFRTVLPFKDATDERLTSITKISEKIYTVFSGKIVNCVQTAEEILSRIKNNY